MKRIHITLWFWFGLVGIVGAWLSVTPITSVDLEQTRLNQAAPLLKDGFIAQTFVPQHNGLSSIEVLAIVYPISSTTTASLILRLQTSTEDILAERTFTVVQHNQLLKLDFAPILDSKGREFSLQIYSTPDSYASVWAYSLDGETSGRLYFNEELLANDLYFTTRYTYLVKDMLRDVIFNFELLAPWLLALWLTLFAPGLLVLKFLRARNWLADHWARLGVALGVSIALNALIWQWATIINWRWTPITLWGFYGVAGGLTLTWIFLEWRLEGFRLKFGFIDTLLISLVLGALFVRLLAIRDLEFPQWVDSPHHLIIAQLMAEHGQMPSSYEPLLPINAFTYHFGFHALATTWHLLIGQDWLGVFLLGGQHLNSLMVLAIYSGVYFLTGRSGAGVWAAWVVACVSLFPAYYVSWGRYTQLTGLLILVPLLAFTWRLVEQGNAEKEKWKWLGIIAVLASGLTLTHYRVLFFYATFVLVALAFGMRRGWQWIGVATLLTCLLSSPWLGQLAFHSIVPTINEPASLASPTGYNVFPWDYFTSPLEQGWYAIAGVLAVWGLWHRHRLIWGAVAWVIITASLLNIGPGSWLVNNNSWAISLFIPGALVFGIGADDLIRTSQQWISKQTVSYASIRFWLGHLVVNAFAVFIGLTTVFGLGMQISIVNPTTTLYKKADFAALNWIKHNIPREAVFAHNSWNWQYGIWASTDGGAWLLPWLGYQSTLPPTDYIYEPDWAYELVDFNKRLMGRKDARAPETLALWQEMGVTHIYIGARGGNLKPEMFVGVPGYKLLYTNGAAWVFEIER